MLEDFLTEFLPRPVLALPLLLRHPRAMRDQIVAFQSRQLRRLVTHAYNKVPYYQKLFDRNRLKPEDIRTVADLSAIPITSKKDLQPLLPKEIVARGVDPDRLIVHKTSGSSGEPLIVRKSWFEKRLFGLFRLRAMRYFGLRMRDKQAQIILVQPADPRDNQLPFRVLQRLGLLRTLAIDCRQTPETILQRLSGFRPDVLTGFAGVLSRVAQTVRDGNGCFVHPRFIAVGGEVLTRAMRQQISQAFAAPVFEMYASHEFHLIAWECKTTGEYHTCDDGIILEVLKHGRPARVGERGEVVGTNLHSFAMPFIRYRLGDIVTKGSETCPCGQPFSTIRTIHGRMIDYFPLPDGRLLHPYEIVGLMLERAPWIREYRLIQERKDRVVLQVLPFAAPSPYETSRLREPIAALLGEDVEFQVIPVSHIPLEANGKFRISRSFVTSLYDEVAWDEPYSEGAETSGHDQS